MLCDVCDTVEAYLCVVGVDDALLVDLPLDWQELDEDGWCGEWLSLGEELDVLVPELDVCDADGCDAVIGVLHAAYAENKQPCKDCLVLEFMIGGDWIAAVLTA